MIAYPKLVNQTQKSQEEVVQALPVIHLLKPTNEGPITKIHQHLRFSGINDEDNRSIVEIVIGECKNQLEVILKTHVPSWNCRLGDFRHQEELRDIGNEQINPYTFLDNCQGEINMVNSNLHYQQK